MITDYEIMLLLVRAKEADLLRNAEARRVRREFVAALPGVGERAGWALIQLGLRLSSRGRQHWSAPVSPSAGAS
jgi:hypothetical protein